MKTGISREEVHGLIRATEEIRIRLKKTWQKIEDLQATVDASQDARLRRQTHDHRPVNKNTDKDTDHSKKHK